MSGGEVSSPASDILEEIWDEKADSPHLGQVAALLCLDSDEIYSGLELMLQRMGYVVDIPTVVDQALDQLRLNQYQIVLFSEHFGGKIPNSVASYLAGLNMHIRREMFVVIVGERFKTGNHFQAFVESVDLVIHPEDLPRIEMILSKGLHDRSRLYKVFVECLVEAGKKM